MGLLKINDSSSIFTYTYEKKTATLLHLLRAGFKYYRVSKLEQIQMRHSLFLYGRTKDCVQFLKVEQTHAKFRSRPIMDLNN